MLREHNSEAYGDWMKRSQRKIHWKDELTWPAHILTCSPHVLSHVLALNGTSLLAVTCPCKNQAGWPEPGLRSKHSHARSSFHILAMHKLEREQKSTKRGVVGRERERLPASPLIWQMPTGFHGWVHLLIDIFGSHAKITIADNSATCIYIPVWRAVISQMFSLRSAFPVV